MSKATELLEKLKVEEAGNRTASAIFNGLLAHIGGNTANFLNADTLTKIEKEFPDIVKDPQYIALAKEIEELYAEWHKVQSGYEQRGRQLRDKAGKFFKEVAGETAKYI